MVNSWTNQFGCVLTGCIEESIYGGLGSAFTALELHLTVVVDGYMSHLATFYVGNGLGQLNGSC